jgi:23S rRNA U2552 (ribose-2'-O)-methylase RlmE/FtsJ
MTATGIPGASLRVWRDYFTKATVYGIDIDEGVLFSSDRIKTARVDQRDPESFQAFWSSVGEPHFDVIIDDGLHEFQANVTFFEASSKALSPGGIFIIEDCDPETVDGFREYFQGSQAWNVQLFMLYRQNMARVNDNVLLVITNRRATPRA